MTRRSYPKDLRSATYLDGVGELIGSWVRKHTWGVRTSQAYLREEPPMEHFTGLFGASEVAIVCVQMFSVGVVHLKC